MLWFSKLFKRKKIDTTSIKEFDSAVNAINIFIAISEWEKAKSALTEVRYKEKDSLNKLIEIIEKEDDEEIVKIEKQKQILKQKKKEKKLKSIEIKLLKKEEEYNKKMANERFKIRFHKIIDEVQILKWANKNNQALSLIKKLLEENPWNRKIIKYYNSEKKKIKKSLQKQNEQENKKIKQNELLEAQKLIWEDITIKKEKDKENDKHLSFFAKIKKWLNFYQKIKERKKKKKLLDEISLLIEEDSKIKKDVASRKLENIHKWLVKELKNEEIVWYDLYWKILWADKISWDSFWIHEWKDKYRFFLWDATWHWIRAWFIITLLSRFFNKYVKNSSFKELIFEINNWLKQDIPSRNFITWIFFQIDKKTKDIKYVWLWHEPMLIYKKKTATVEKLIGWWLAAGIRIMKDADSSIIEKELKLDDWDIVLTYSDWIVENRNDEWEFYWIDKLKDTFLDIATTSSSIEKIYEYIIQNVKFFQWWMSFTDDATILLFKRDENKDIIEENSEYLEKITQKEWLKKSDIKKLKWKTKTEIEKELESMKKEKETDRIIKILESLYYTWEILKLKQEAIRYIKEWYIHKKINYYLRKALDNEKAYKIDQKEQKIKNKYNVLEELYKKGDYNTVIEEVEEIIAKDWNI